MHTCRHNLFSLYLMFFHGQKRHVKLTRKCRPILVCPLLFYGCPPPTGQKETGNAQWLTSSFSTDA